MLVFVADFVFPSRRFSPDYYHSKCELTCVTVPLIKPEFIYKKHVTVSKILCNCVCAGKPTGQARLQQSEDEQEADGEEEDDEDEYDKAEEWRRMDGADALRRRGVGVTEEDT